MLSNHLMLCLPLLLLLIQFQFYAMETIFAILMLIKQLIGADQGADRC